MNERNKTHAENAALAHTDLNIFEAVVALMEHSLLSAACFKAEAKIIAICKREGQKCLARYDAALARMNDQQRRSDG